MNKDRHTKDPTRNNTTTEEYLDEVTVGERESLDSTIDIVPSDPDWPAKFARHARRIREALSEKVLFLEHVGSTSVPGLAAKPVVDMVLVVADSADEPSYVPLLEKSGFVLRAREPNWFEHRLLQTPQRDANLHVFSTGCEEIERMLAFRDWLRRNQDDRLLYEKTKLELAAHRWKHMQEYADAKSEVVQAIMARALNSEG